MKRIITILLAISIMLTCVGSVAAQEYKTDKFEKFLCMHACYCKGKLFTKPISDRVCEIHCVNHGKKFVVDLDEYLENGWCIHENMTDDERKCLDCKQVFTYSDYESNTLKKEETIESLENKLCNHTDFIENVTVERRNVDQSEYHLVVEIRKTTCKRCGELSEDEVIIGQESHISQKDKNICTLCSGEINCHHSEKSKTTLKSFAKFIDGDYHEYTYETVQKCNRCAMNVDVLNSWTERERHDIEDYYCADCNYNVPHCQHNTEEKVVDRQVISSRDDQHYSLVTWVQQCKLCGERIGNQYSGNVMEDHVYDSNGICECGQAQSKKIGYVSEKVETDRLNVRWSPEISPSNIAGKLYLGDEVVIVGEAGGFYRIEFANGEAFVHKDYITFTKPIVSANISSSYLQNVAAFISDSRWKNGTSWDGNQTPKLSSYSSWGCCAYCSDFVKYVFNKPSPRSGAYFTNINEIRNGDVLYVTPMHWIVVLERNGNTLKTAEANWGSRVVIGNNYSISNGKLYRNGKIASTFQYGYHFSKGVVSVSQTSTTVLQSTSATTNNTNQGKINFVNSMRASFKSTLDAQKQASDNILAVINDVYLRKNIERTLGVTAVSVKTLNPINLGSVLSNDAAVGLAGLIVSQEFARIADISYYKFLELYKKGEVKTEAEAKELFEAFKSATSLYQGVISSNYDTVASFTSKSYYTKAMLKSFLSGIADSALGSLKVYKAYEVVNNTTDLYELIKSSGAAETARKETVNKWQSLYDKA